MADILTPDGNAIPPGDREPSPTIQGDDETVRGPHAGHTVAPGDTDDTNIPDTNLPSGNGPKFSVRCQPCSDRGRYSFCDKTWPICSKCAQEGTSDQCFHAYTDPPSHSDQPPPSPLITDQRGRPPPHPDVRTTRASAATLGPPPADLTRRAASATPTIHAPPVSARGLPQPLLDRRRSQSPPPPPATPREVSRVRSPPRMRSLQNLSEERQIQLERLEFLRTELRRAEQEAGLPPSQPFHPPTSATPAQTYAPVSHTATHNPPIGMHAHAHGTRRSDPDFISSSIYAGDFYAERKRPQVIPGLVGSREFAYIPDALRRAFTGPNAWTTGVSLWHFSDEYAMDPSKHARVNDTITLNENGQLVQHRGELPRVNESTLDVGTFIRCWQRANGLLHSIRHPDASVWEEHVRLMMRQPDFFTDFPKWLKYCGLVRQRALQQGIDPSVLQKGILSEVTVEYERNRLLADTRRCIREELDRRDAANSQRSHMPSSSSNIAPRIQPKQPQAPRGKGAVADSSKNPPICFLCGSPSHISTGCEHPSIAVRNAQGNWSVAVPPATLPNSAPPDPRRIVTPLLPDAWLSALATHNLLDRFSDVYPGLCYGFRLGISSTLFNTTIHKNHSSAEDNPHAITKHIEEELAAGCYSGPFTVSTLNSLIGHFRASPLGVVDKPSSPGSFRIIQDFSFPRGKEASSSVNSEIDPTQFECEWGFFQDVEKIILSLPPGSEAATFDVDAAYRRMPVHPDDQPHIVVHWRGAIYLDHCVPFGARSSNGIFGRCGDAMLWIMAARGIKPAVKWVDDFCIFRIPTAGSWPHNPVFLYDEEDIYMLAAKLGWPWKRSKTRPFFHIFAFLGLEWNIQDQTVSIPQAKKDKFLAKITAWLSAPAVTLLECESLLGSLIHCALAVPVGKSHVVGLARLTSSFSHPHADRYIKRKPSARATEDIIWWQRQLSLAWCGSTLRAPPPDSGTELYMDASTSFGVGVVCPASARFGMWKLSNGAFRAGRDIGWAEMIAIELGLDILISEGCRDRTVTFRSDNQGVIGALKAGRSRNDQQNLALQRIVEKQYIHNINIKIEYVATDSNVADGPSRGSMPVGLTPFSNTITIDQYLAVFIQPVIGASPPMHTAHVD